MLRLGRSLATLADSPDAGDVLQWVAMVAFLADDVCVPDEESLRLLVESQ